MPSHMEDMEELRRRYGAGQKRAVMDALFICLSSRKSVPRWVGDAFEKAFWTVTSAGARSWDDVFGKPWPKGARLKDARTRIEYRYQIWHYCRSLHANGMPIGAELFE